MGGSFMGALAKYNPLTFIGNAVGGPVGSAIDTSTGDVPAAFNNYTVGQNAPNVKAYTNPVGTGPLWNGVTPNLADAAAGYTAAARNAITNASGTPPATSTVTQGSTANPAATPRQNAQTSFVSQFLPRQQQNTYGS
jgi:hypothetical protein